MPDVWREDEAARAVAFLERVAADVAGTGAQWMAAGFVHGVLNTDNINVTGESFDYGPWRFLPHYDPDFTAAYFDQSGLYAFGRQPATLLWNLARLAECLLPLAPPGRAGGGARQLRPAFQRALATRCCAGWACDRPARQQDGALVEALFGFLESSQAPFEQIFFDWHGGLASAERAARSPSAELYAVGGVRPGTRRPWLASRRRRTRAWSIPISPGPAHARC